MNWIESQGLATLGLGIEGTYMTRAESSSPIAFMCSVMSKARSVANDPGMW